jgi:hypothetical protein
MQVPGANLANRETRNKRMARVGDRATVTAEHAPDVRTGVITHIERRGVTIRSDGVSKAAHGFNWSWNEFDLDAGVQAPLTSECLPVEREKLDSTETR